MNDILVFRELSDGLYVGTNSSEEIANAFQSGVEIPSKLTIPYSHNNLIVTHIGMNAFYKCQQLENIEIKARLLYIHYHAFCGCQNLKSINIPSTCTFIGNSVLDARDFDTNKTSQGALVIYFEKNSVIGFIGHAAISNFRSFSLYVFDILSPVCEYYFLGGAQNRRVYAPTRYSFCGLNTTLFRPIQTCNKISIIFEIMRTIVRFSMISLVILSLVE